MERTTRPTSAELEKVKDILYFWNRTEINDDNAVLKIYRILMKPKDWNNREKLKARHRLSLKSVESKT